MLHEPGNAAVGAGKANRASTAISTRLCAAGEAWPPIGMARKILRKGKGENQGLGALRADDRRRSPGQVAGDPAPDQRGFGIRAGSADELQELRAERFFAAAKEKMEGLDRHNNHRTFRSSFASAVRDLRDSRPYPRPAPAAAQREDWRLALALGGCPSRSSGLTALAMALGETAA